MAFEFDRFEDRMLEYFKQEDENRTEAKVAKKIADEYKKAIGDINEPSESEDLAKLNDQAAEEMNTPGFDDDEKKGGLTDEDIPF